MPRKKSPGIRRYDIGLPPEKWSSLSMAFEPEGGRQWQATDKMLRSGFHIGPANQPQKWNAVTSLLVRSRFRSTLVSGTFWVVSHPP